MFKKQSGFLGFLIRKRRQADFLPEVEDNEENKESNEGNQNRESQDA